MSNARHHSEQMVSRIVPDRSVHHEPPAPAAGPKFNIVIASSVDDAELLRMTEDDQGRLVVTGDEARWDEGAKVFLYQMMQWAGLVSIRWKEEVKAAVPE